MGYGKGADLEGSSLEFLDDLDELTRSNVSRTNAILAISANEMLLDLQGRYQKLTESGGTNNRFTAQQLYARIGNTADLLPSAYKKNVLSIMQEDLAAADIIGRKAGVNLQNILKDGSETLKANAKPNKAAIENAGKRLDDFWSKENTRFRDRVRSLTQNAAAQGMSWRKLSGQIRELLLLEQAQGTESRRSRNLRMRMGVTFRADTIARTELATAYVQGQIAHYREQGFEWGRWSAAAERTCGYCMSRDGLVYTMDDLEAAIPAHPRCRCAIIPTDPPADVRKGNKVDPRDASDHLDDLYWTKSRERKLNQWKDENRGIRDPKTESILNGMLRDFAKTPTNSQQFLRPGQPAPEPKWMPSGEIIPDVKKAAQAQEDAATRQQDGAKRKEQEAEAARKAKEAEAAQKQAEREELKRRQEEERRQVEQAEKEREALVKKLADAEAKLAKAGNTQKRLELEKAKAKLQGELDVIDARLAPIVKRLKEIEAKQAQLKKDMEFVKDMTDNQRSAQADADALTQRAGQAALKKNYAESRARDLKQQLETAKKSTGKKFDLDEYDRQIARQNHDMQTLIKIGEDVLRRAGTTMEKVKQPGTGPTAEMISAQQQAVTKAKREQKMIEKNLKISQKNLEIIDKNEAMRRATIDHQFERGDMERQTYERRIKESKKYFEDMREVERKYQREDHQKQVEMIAKRVKMFEQQLAELKSKSVGPSGAQDVIDELMSSSPITRKDAEALVKDAASTANRKKSLTQGRSKSLRPVPKDFGLDDMIDAVHMYGTRSSMDRYGLASERAHAHSRVGDPKTGLNRHMADGYVNSGAGYGDFRGTQFHELGHHLEMQNSDFYRASRQFLKQRAEAGDGIDPNTKMTIGSPLWLGLKSGVNYGRNEVGYILGRAYNPYVLKEYDSQRLNQYGGLLDRQEVFNWMNATDYTAVHQKAGLATEVVSMGVEKLSSASNLQKLAEQDPEHLLLSLGVVKVQQARAKNGIDRFSGQRDTQAPITTEAEIPNGVGRIGRGKSSEADRRKIQKEIDKAEQEAKQLKKDLDKIVKEADAATSKSRELWEEINKLRSVDDIVEELRDLSNQVNDLRDRSDIERVARFDKAKSLKDIERQLESLGAQ